MTGEEGPFDRSTNRSMAAKGPVAAGEECVMEKRKRKAAEMEADDELNQGAMKAKGEVVGIRSIENKKFPTHMRNKSRDPSMICRQRVGIWNYVPS